MQVKDLEKREIRLKEVFKTQVSNFREACYCLFGYRVDMASQVPNHKIDPLLIQTAVNARAQILRAPC